MKPGKWLIRGRSARRGRLLIVLPPVPDHCTLRVSSAKAILLSPSIKACFMHHSHTQVCPGTSA